MLIWSLFGWRPCEKTTAANHWDLTSLCGAAAWRGARCLRFEDASARSECSSSWVARPATASCCLRKQRRPGPGRNTGIGRRCLRQRHVRELLRHARMRTAGATQVHVQDRGQDGLLQLHRRLVQPDTAALGPRLPLANGL